MKQPPAHSKSSGPSTRRVVSIVAAVFCVIIALGALIVGVVFLVLSQADYSGHTGRAEAVVTEVDVDVDKPGCGFGDRETDPECRGEGIEDTTTYVDYRAEGQEFTRVQLSGLNPGSYSEGESLTVAYDPADPGDPVTAQTAEPGAMPVETFFWVGAVLLTVGGVAALGVIVLIVVAVRG